MMNLRSACIFFCFYTMIAGCDDRYRPDTAIQPTIIDSNQKTPAVYDTTLDTSALLNRDTIPRIIEGAKNIDRDSLLNYAVSLIGTPYKYGSTDPQQGFDCSGYITHVFNHFNTTVPRSSKDFEYSGPSIPVAEAKKGDLILFTGTDSTERIIGHMGIVISNTNELQFIHSSSGKAHGVTISPLDNYYKGRFVKVVRILKDNY
ncbi:hypothetical protein BH09BAC2_BH09BAC2_07730 [soil metagenome]